MIYLRKRLNIRHTSLTRKVKEQQLHDQSEPTFSKKLWLYIMYNIEVQTGLDLLLPWPTKTLTK